MSNLFRISFPKSMVKKNCHKFVNSLSSRCTKRLSTLSTLVSNNAGINFEGKSDSYSCMNLYPAGRFNNHNRNRENRNNNKSKFQYTANNFGLFGVAMAAIIYANFKIMNKDKKAKSCGIVGVISHSKEVDARDFLLEGLTILQNRGYDSAGIATIGAKTGEDGKELHITKYASQGSTSDSIDLLKKNSKSRHTKSNIGIAHTRWATHGGKTDENAHPHTDYKGRIALVHNGTINNSHDLKTWLEQKHHIKFKSETDTEVIAQLIGVYLDEQEKEGKVKIDLKKATSDALSKCDGAWGICVMHIDNDDELVVACNGSPMVLGIGENKTYIASETTAFSRYTKNFIAMKDGEIASIHSHGHDIDLTRVQMAPDVDILLTPHPYPHWTIRECLEQPEAIARSLGFGGRMSENTIFLGGLDRNASILSEIENLVITGCGTSLHAGLYGAKLMREFDSFNTVDVVDSAEFSPQRIPKIGGGLLAVSQSGETKDVHRAVVVAQNYKIPTFSVVNSVGSLIARTTELGCYLHAGRESGVASTKAFTTQVTVMALIAAWFRQLRDIEAGRINPGASTKALQEALQRLPISFGMARHTRKQCKEVAQKLLHSEHVFILGRGYGEPIAYEGALKLKEMAYIHAEGFSGGALKHGPFALIEGKEGKFGKTPIICILLDDEHAQHMRTAAYEVKARGAELFVITDNPKLATNLCDDPIVIPSNGILTALISVLPLQFIGYELALLRGINPDKPRNLAKAVTVD